MARQTNRGPLRALSFAAVVLVAVIGFAGVGAAQDGGSSSSTTQLDLGGGSTTTTAPGSTSTTQLDLGGGSTPSPSVAGDSTTAPQPPTRVDAGAGGAASSDASLPLGLVGLAAGLIVATGAAAERVRRARDLP